MKYVLAMLCVATLLCGSSALAGRQKVSTRLTSKAASTVKKIFKHAPILGGAALLTIATPTVALEKIIRQAPVLTSSPGVTLVARALAQRDPMLLRLVLASSAVDINAMTYRDSVYEGEGQATALHVAVNYGLGWGKPKEEAEVVEVLLEYGADPFIADRRGWNVFEGIEAYGYDGHEKDMFSAVLTKHVYGINGKDETGASPLEYAQRFASYGGETWLARKLVAEGAIPLHLAAAGATPVHAAAASGDFARLQALLTSNEYSAALVNVVDKHGNTPLHYAVADMARASGFDAVNKFAAVNVLLAHGAFANIKNRDGLTPYDHLYRLHARHAPLQERSVEIIAYVAAVFLQRSTGDQYTSHWADGVAGWIAAQGGLIKQLVEEKQALPDDALRDYVVFLHGRIEEYNGY